MQCVKLRSVMGSYINIHLNLFPIYVLLLLLTLSHGRPSAKVRETGDLSKSHHRHQQLKSNSKWYQLNNLYPASNLNSVSEYNSVAHGKEQPISHPTLTTDSDQQVYGIPTSIDSNGNRIIHVEFLKGATGRTIDSAEERNQLDSQQHTTEKPQEQKVENKAKEAAAEQAIANSQAGLLPANSGIKSEKNEQQNTFPAPTPTTVATHVANQDEEEEQHFGRNHSAKWHMVVPDASFHDVSSNALILNESGSGANKSMIQSPDAARYYQNAPYLDESQALDFVLEEESAKLAAGSDQQLVTFRQNILRSLGHPDGALESDVVLKPSNVTLDYNDEDSLAKYNISREEYLQAYTEYITNVKNRRLAARGLTGVRDRRRNAVTITKTYHDNGTDLFSIGSKVLKLFRFEMQYAPTMEGTDVRIQRVVLSIPAMCQLTGQLQNSTDLPDLNQLSELSAMDENCENEDNDTEQGAGPYRRIDLTRNVTAWTVRNHKTAPFIVMAICSRDGAVGAENNLEEQQHPVHRQRHHHGSSLKMVTREFLKPTPEAVMRRRVRRAAPTERSTLRSFNHKRDNGKGRECANTRHGKTCCRRSLKIKFSDLGISDVILEPKEFDAHVCDGRCNARRVAYASTHAMFQHILHQTKGKKFAPRPCCVPTALQELDVLHMDPNGNRNGGPKLVVTILKDAIVKECGCS